MTLKNSAIAVGINYDYAKEVLKKYNQLESKPPDGEIWTGSKVARWLEKENPILELMVINFLNIPLFSLWENSYNF